MQLPAVFVSATYRPALRLPGASETVVAPTSQPRSSPPHILPIRRSPVMCCGRSPGFDRPARMLSMRMRVPVIAAWHTSTGDHKVVMKSIKESIMPLCAWRSCCPRCNQVASVPGRWRCAGFARRLPADCLQTYALL